MNQWRDTFAAHGIDLSWERGALEVVALRAHAHGLGARSLLAELDVVFRDLAFTLPGAYDGALHVDAELVENPGAALLRLMSDADTARASSGSA